MIKSSPVINFLAMMMCGTASVLRIIPFGACGFQHISRQVWTGRRPVGLTRAPSSLSNSPLGSVPFNTRLAFSSKSPEPSTNTLQLVVSTAADLEEVGALLAVLAAPPDALFLYGELGSGKTTLARGFVLSKLCLVNDDDQALRVTSPTYLLSNTYSYQDGYSEKLQEIHHMDLYRLSGVSPNSFESLQLDRVFDKCISLVEWPSRLESQPQLLPSNTYRLDVTISIVPKSNSRLITLTAPLRSKWNERLQILMDEGMVDDLLYEQ